MPMENGDILIFKHFQELSEQEVLNVFTMRIIDIESGDPDNYYGVARGFYFIWANLIKTVQTTALSHLRTEVTELTGLEQGIYANPTPVIGTAVSPMLPTFNAASIQFIRASRLTRHGWKRIAGLTEGSVTLNDLTVDAIDDINAAIAGALVVGGAVFPQIDTDGDTVGEFTIEPVIVGDPIPPSSLFRINSVNSVIVKPQVTTQNTRKVGRGS